ncbi:MAG: hypothetical protein U7M05_11470 [Candidatus Igneacidithiobacillus chanchocoensis]
MKTRFQKIQSENNAVILFFGIVAAILGALMAVLSNYPPPAYILGASAFGLAAGGIIGARRESRYIVWVFQSEIDKAEEFAERHIQSLNPPQEFCGPIFDGGPFYQAE